MSFRTLEGAGTRELKPRAPVGTCVSLRSGSGSVVGEGLQGSCPRQSKVRLTLLDQILWECSPLSRSN